MSPWRPVELVPTRQFLPREQARIRRDTARLTVVGARVVGDTLVGSFSDRRARGRAGGRRSASGDRPVQRAKDRGGPYPSPSPWPPSINTMTKAVTGVVVP